jgi:hypothetical protein
MKGPGDSGVAESAGPLLLTHRAALGLAGGQPKCHKA